MDAAITIDEDVLAEARMVAERDNRPLEQVVSDWARTGMKRQVRTTMSRAGFPVLAKRGVVVTTELVNRLRDEE